MESRGHKRASSLISETILRILDEGSVAALATLTDGAPNVGAKLLIHEHGEEDTTAGSLGTDELDKAVIEHAVTFLASREETHFFRVNEFAPALNEFSEAQILFERIQREPRLVICGAGHVGASLAKLAAEMGYRATLIDDRAEFVSRERFTDQPIELVAADNWADDVGAAMGNGHGVFAAIVTRGHSEDEQCLRAVIATEPDYIGLIGSKRRTNIVLQRLRETGVPEDKLLKVHAPIGLDIGAVTPEEVALAIMAEIISVRRGGAGGSLSEWRRAKVKGEKGNRERGKRPA
ncbi:MAG: XdhC family protein [Pyrinomonadaceae bacterium]